MNKIIEIRWTCDPCKLNVVENVAMCLQLKDEHWNGRVCACCGSPMNRELMRGDVDLPQQGLNWEFKSE